MLKTESIIRKIPKDEKQGHESSRKAFVFLLTGLGIRVYRRINNGQFKFATAVFNPKEIA